MNILKFKEFINESKYSDLSDKELDDILNDALDKSDAKVLNDISPELVKRYKYKEKPMSRIDRLNHEISKSLNIKYFESSTDTNDFLLSCFRDIKIDKNSLKEIIKNNSDIFKEIYKQSTPHYIFFNFLNNELSKMRKYLSEIDIIDELKKGDSLRTIKNRYDKFISNLESSEITDDSINF